MRKLIVAAFMNLHDVIQVGLIDNGIEAFRKIVLTPCVSSGLNCFR
ncbi:hypothetical protein [Pseudomonas chlororaphis]|nr:hypothetical protein [Pseudomonas chlororaphis]